MKFRKTQPRLPYGYMKTTITKYSNQISILLTFLPIPFFFNPILLLYKVTVAFFLIRMNFFYNQLQDQMIDVYKKEGAFPASLPSKHFEGPIRAHYRPRRIWSILIMMFSSYFTLPPVFYALYTLLCSGIINVLLALFFVFGGKEKPRLYINDFYEIFQFFLIFPVMFGLYKLVGLTRVSSTGSTYGETSRNKSS